MWLARRATPRSQNFANLDRLSIKDHVQLLHEIALDAC